MARQRGELRVGVRRRLRGERRLEEALGDEVGESPVGRRRVRVVPHGEPEVSVGRAARRVEDVLARAEELHHREREIGEARGVRPASRGEERLERARVRRPWEPLAEVRRKGDDALPALGGAEDPPQRGEAACLEELRGHAVGGDHEVLDQLPRAVRLVGSEIGEHVTVEHRPGLERLEAQRAAVMAQRLHRLRDPILKPELRVEAGDRGDARRRRRRAVEPRGDGVVGELGVVDDARAIDVAARRCAVRPDRHIDDHREPLPALAEGGEVGRQLLGEHRKDFGRRVHRGRVRLRVAVDRGALPHDRVHVGDRDQDRHRVAARRLGDRELVEIPRVVVVDGGPEETAKVPDGGIAVLGGLGDRARLGEDGGREVGLEPALAHRPPGDLPELAPMGARRRTHARRAPGIARRPT